MRWLALALVLAGCGPAIRWSSVPADELIARAEAPLGRRAPVLKGRIYAAARAPGSLLFDVVTPTDDSVATLVMDEGRFMSVDARARRCWVGEACASNVARVVPIPLDGADLLRVLWGLPPRFRARTANTERQRDPPRYRIVLEGEGSTSQTVFVDPNGRDLRRCEWRRDGAVVLDIRWGAYLDHQGVGRIPGRIDVHDRVRETTVSLNLLETQRLEERDGTFSTRCPPGTTPSILSCESARAPPTSR